MTQAYTEISSKFKGLAYKISGIESDFQGTIILEAGVGDGLEKWAETFIDWNHPFSTKPPSVLQELEKLGRIFRYDRLGQGQSDNLETVEGIPATQTVDRLEALLDELLARGEIKGPLILVGHSMGGLYMQFLAARYAAEKRPNLVKGVVLIDSCVNEQMSKEMIENGWAREVPEPRDGSCCGFFNNGPIKAEHCETKAQAQHHVPGFLFPREIPLQVINAGHNDWGSPDNQKTMRGWHQALARQSDESDCTISNEAIHPYYNLGNNAHYPHLYSPQLLVDKVQKIIALPTPIQTAAPQDAAQHQPRLY